ncbi:hypothetical protein BKA67DRAFT_166371 [Truncatella angustata]|uniref:Uncharacterized protein n=1 Tax=Truncatella angustata TaxID=152316 RepID=A0A9P8UQS0_9PEZI|nr:uncharacterized protein BKA67DRAFT_166371 [Truncatella angustata]KAH6656742.1 hypothetical protein BKA67DRAFT_166371 [Truncatella angustata]
MVVFCVVCSLYLFFSLSLSLNSKPNGAKEIGKVSMNRSIQYWQQAHAGVVRTRFCFLSFYLFCFVFVLLFQPSCVWNDLYQLDSIWGTLFEVFLFFFFFLPAALSQ